MLALARTEADRRRFKEITFVEGDPHALPFPDDSFVIVASAAALHHFTSPAKAIQEMARTCVPGGAVAIEDVVTSEQDIRARYHNRIERLRDRTHQRLLSLSEVISLLGRAGLQVCRVEVQDSIREYNEWLGVTRPPPRRSERIHHLLQGSVEQDLCGLSVQGEDDTFIFIQRVAWVLAVKSA